MSTIYTDNPKNMDKIFSYIHTDKETIVSMIHSTEKCFFYDTCSFRYHAKFTKEAANYLFDFIKRQNGIVVLTRCILMELASDSGSLNKEYITYLKNMHQFGIEVLLIYEENIFEVMDVCFATNKVINNYLSWAVRMIKNPVSTITDTLKRNSILKSEIIENKNAQRGDLYERFFKAVRDNKERGDNLGEELLAICLHILSYIPGTKDGKFCVITDDKGAAGTIDHLFKKTSLYYKGSRINIFSTPKLVQFMYREGVLDDCEYMNQMLGTGNTGNIVIYGMRSFDFSNREISINCEELVDLIRKPNEVYIVF